MFDVCVCSPLYVYTSPKKTSKQEKRKNMQQKYLRLEACSLKIHHVFLWADLGLRKKGGKKRKEKIQKRLLAKTGKKRISKKEKKKEQKGQISKSSWLLIVFVFFLFFPFKKSTKAKTKGITDTVLSQEKTQDQRKLFSFLAPCRRKWLPLCLSYLTLFVPWTFFSVVGLGKRRMWSTKAFVDWRTGPCLFFSQHMTRKTLIFEKWTGKEADT